MHEPSALVWDLLLLLTVILFGPFVAERLRLPGIIGLLLGGFLIGPTGLGLRTFRCRPGRALGCTAAWSVLDG